MSRSHRLGDDVLISDGPFIGRVATIAALRTTSAVVCLPVFDRETAVEVPYAHLLPPPDAGGEFVIRDA